MTRPTLSRLELKIMRVFWDLGACAVRAVHDNLPHVNRPAYTTVQTAVYRLESKGAVVRVRKVRNAHIFEPTISQYTAEQDYIADSLRPLAGQTEWIIPYLIESGQLTLKDIEQSERMLRLRLTKRKR